MQIRRSHIIVRHNKTQTKQSKHICYNFRLPNRRLVKFPEFLIRQSFLAIQLWFPFPAVLLRISVPAILLWLLFPAILLRSCCPAVVAFSCYPAFGGNFLLFCLGCCFLLLCFGLSYPAFIIYSCSSPLFCYPAMMHRFLLSCFIVICPAGILNCGKILLSCSYCMIMKAFTVLRQNPAEIFFGLEKLLIPAAD